MKYDIPRFIVLGLLIAGIAAGLDVWLFGGDYWRYFYYCVVEIIAFASGVISVFLFRMNDVGVKAK